MKLGVIFNVFDGMELFPYAVSSVRPHCDYITVIYQTTSNRGNTTSTDVKGIIKNLLDFGMIDNSIEYIPSQYLGAPNEIDKRNHGLDSLRSVRCTHLLCMDVDEFYDDEQFKANKKVIEEGNFDASACQMSTYYHDPIYRLEPKEEYYVPWICKMQNTPDFKFGYPSFPVLVDPTRKLPHSSCKIFERSELEMHHFSWVRNDIDEKIRNSSAYIQGDLNLSTRYKQWKFGDKVYYPGIGETDVVEVENKFNITLWTKLKRELQKYESNQ